MKIKKLSVVIPVYNERNTIEIILERLQKADFGGAEKEIIIVDDGSKDGTREILKKYETIHKIIYHPINIGKGAAVRNGFEQATGDYVIVQDADLEYDPADIKLLIEEAEKKDAAVVYGSRRLGNMSKKNPMAGWHYYMGGVTLSVLTNLLYWTKITDEATGYKMIRRDILEKLNLKSTGFEFCPELTAKIAKRGFKIYEVPITYKPRTVKEGKKIKFKDAIIAVWVLIKHRFVG